MAAPDVLFALPGDVRRNSRAIKQLRALAALGLGIEVLSVGGPAGETRWDEGIRGVGLPRPAGSGPRFFARLHARVRAAALPRRARIYHASDFYMLPALAAAARRHGGRLVYDARELYTRVAATTGRPAVRLFWQAVERRYIRQADAVFTVSDSIADFLAAQYGIVRPEVLHNVPPLQTVAPSDYLREQTGASATTTLLLHQGNIQKHRGCFLLADAMAGVQGGLLVFLGGGPLRPALEAHVEAAGLTNRIRFLDPVPPDALLPVTASADVGITLLEDVCLNHRFALPNKLFEYLMAGLPVLASDLPEIRRVVEDFRVGRVVDPADRAALVKALQAMVDDENQRARWAANTPGVFETFRWEKASQRLQDRYRTLLSP